MMNLIQLLQSMYRRKYERKTVDGIFKPYFYRVIGAEDEDNYNNQIKTLKDKCDSNKKITLLFDGSIPLSGEMELINYIFNELNNMNVTKLSAEEINLFDDLNINKLFLNSLEYVVNLAIAQEKFFNNNVRNNFITKLIVWAYSYLKEIDFNDEVNPKCIYYGNIGRHEIYFLIMLYLMGFDVLYINPLKEEYFSEIESKGFSTLEKHLKILEIETFSKRAAKGKTIENVETITKQIQREVDDTLFTDTMMFKPWQFRDGNTKSVLLDTIVEDIYTYWNEPSKMRTGFKVKGKLVTVPCFFMKIDGMYQNISEYQKLIKFCINSPNTLFFNNSRFSNEDEVSDEMYSLMFSQLSDGSFDLEDIKKNPVYKYGKYSIELQNFILNKFNETILDQTLFKQKYSKNEILKMLTIILNLNENIIRLLDNFDYPFNVPKVVIFLDKEEQISDSMLFLLCFLHKAAVDIVIFNPSGLLNINKVIKEQNVNTFRLDQVKYDVVYKNVINHKESFFSRILNK